VNEKSHLIPVSVLLTRRFTLFRRCNDAEIVGDLTAQEYIENVISGRWRTEVESIRQAKERSKAEADDLKVKTLPALTPGGAFTGLDQKCLVRHSGLAVVDIDNLDADLPRVWRLLTERDSYAFMVHRSPCGNGLKCFVPIAATTAEEHKPCYKALLRHYAVLLGDQVEIDSKPQNVAAKCFASFDPEAWIATEPRMAFEPIGGDIDYATVIQSNENELSPSSSSPGIVRIDTGEGAGGGGAFPALPRWIGSDSAEHAVNGLSRGIQQIYLRWLGHVQPRAGHRNDVIVERVPILLNVVGEEMTLRFLMKFYDEAGGVFKDSRDRHMREVQAGIRGCVEGYVTNSTINLNEAERRFYLSANARQREVFRITRSLSLCKENCHKREFFLSAGHLGDRLCCHQQSALRALNSLVRAGVLKLIEPGKQWQAGQKSTGCRYRWLMTGSKPSLTTPRRKAPRRTV
jgi:hypothetical protein